MVPGADSLRDRLPPRPVGQYYLYRATTTFGFFWPVFTVFLLSRDLSYTQIGLLNSLSAALVVVGEVPSGYVGDRIGRRNSLLVGSVLLVASLLGFVVAESFAAFAVVWTLWALGGTFRSGSAAAWLYDALADRLDEDAYTRVEGRAGSVGLWVQAATMLTAGALYAVDPVLPFVANAGLVALSIPVVLSMPATGSHAADDDALTVLEALPLLRRRLSRPPLRSFVVYVALFFGTISAADTFIQPVTVDALRFPETVLGPLYAGFTAVQAVAAYFVGDLEDALGTRGAVLAVTLLVGGLLLAPALAPLAALPLFFAMKSARAVIRPITNGYVNDRVGSAGRATVLSAVAMAYALVRVPLKPAAGVVADAVGPVTVLAVLGAFFVACAALVHAWEAPASDATERAGGVSEG